MGLDRQKNLFTHPFNSYKAWFVLVNLHQISLNFFWSMPKKLKSVQFGSTAWFNDDTVSKVLAKGALRQVEEIRILRSYELTMRAVSVLLEQCPNLHILAEMDGWEGISQLELLQLRKKIREENLDLDTFIA